MATQPTRVNGIDAGSAITLTIGAATATGVSIGKSTGTVQLRGAVQLDRAAITQTTATLTINTTLGTQFDITLQSNVTSISITGLVAQQPRLLFLTFIQDATGSRTVVGWGGSVKFLPTTYRGATHTVTVLTITANARDTIGFWWDGTNLIQISENLNS